MSAPAPPPPDAVALYIRWQAAKEHRQELERTLPPVGETVVGRIATPIQDPRVTDAAEAEVAAATAFYRHPWWYGTASRSEAARVIEAAARAQLARDTTERPHPEE